jgi:uncharacterized glyoxalase superfamily protein PhnB
LNHFECVVPILNVRDCQASLDYYVGKLGFSRKWGWGEPTVFACVTRGKVEIFLCQGAQGHAGTWMSIFVDDVDALHEEYKMRDVIIRLAPTNMPWATREMNVEDLDGHRLRFGSDATGPADEEGLERFSQMEQSSA